MSMTDPIADLLTRIRNASRLGHRKVTSPSSKMRVSVLEVLKREGYIRDFSVSDLSNGGKQVEIELKYVDGAPSIVEITRVSTPGRRVYSSIGDLKHVRGGLGISILSTSSGVMSDHEARHANVGGEVLCKVF